MNVPKAVEEIARQLGFAVKNMPQAIQQGIPSAGKSFQEFGRTIPQGVGMAMRGMQIPSYVVGEAISPTADKSIPFGQRFANDMMTGENSTGESLVKRGVHPALALGAEVAMPSMFQLAAAGTASKALKGGVTIPKLGQFAKGAGIGISKPQMLSLAAGFKPKLNENGEVIGVDYDPKQAMIAMALATGAQAIGGGIKAINANKAGFDLEGDLANQKKILEQLQDLQSKATTIPEADELQSQIDSVANVIGRLENSIANQGLIPSEDVNWLKKAIVDESGDVTPNILQNQLEDAGYDPAVIDRLVQIKTDYDTYAGVPDIRDKILQDFDSILGSKATPMPVGGMATNIPKQGTPAEVFKQAMKEFDKLPEASSAKTQSEAGEIYKAAGNYRMQMYNAAKEAIDNNQIPTSPTLKKQMVQAMLGMNDTIPDHLTLSKDGTFTAKTSYFYTHGNSADKIARQIQQAIPQAKIVEAYDDYKSWPSTSYFTVKFKLPEVATKVPSIPAKILQDLDSVISPKVQANVPTPRSEIDYLKDEASRLSRRLQDMPDEFTRQSIQDRLDEIGYLIQMKTPNNQVQANVPKPVTPRSK